MAFTRINANPREKAVGQVSFKYYENTHAVKGYPRVVNRINSALDKYYGHNVEVKFHGYALDPKTYARKDFTVTKRMQYTEYLDIFGYEASAYLRAMQALAQKGSPYYGMELFTTYTTVTDEI